MGRVLIGPNMLNNMELMMHVIKKNLKASHDRKKSYMGQQRASKDFQVREHVYLHTKPKKRSLNIGSCAKFSPRYCGPFVILERIALVA